MASGLRIRMKEGVWETLQDEIVASPDISVADATKARQGAIHGAEGFFTDESTNPGFDIDSHELKDILFDQKMQYAGIHFDNPSESGDSYLIVATDPSDLFVEL